VVFRLHDVAIDAYERHYGQLPESFRDREF